jgi:ABC-type ATPase with predicted acetyltransferase domain
MIIYDLGSKLCSVCGNRITSNIHDKCITCTMMESKLQTIKFKFTRISKFKMILKQI